MSQIMETEKLTISIPALARVDDEALRDPRPGRRLPEEDASESPSGLPHHPDGPVPVQAARRRQRQDPEGRQVPSHARRLRPLLRRPPAEAHSDQKQIQGINHSRLFSLTLNVLMIVDKL